MACRGILDCIVEPRNASLLILAAAVAAIGGVWAYESLGYLPCELCYKERVPYYAAFALAPLAAFAAQTGRDRLARGAFLLMALLFAGNAILSIYHSGVEWKIFAGPSDCSGPMTTAPSVADFMKELKTTRVVRCDEPNLWIFGLTLANWNVAISVALAWLAFVAVRRGDYR
ncbi:MAG: disulfide bond formation protein B [Alphaproteobacteria bacterium]|nr:disulfide bond formation protein B [Alphaproteobacteria bacterium]MBM3641361.1 disulfide bond formation protein B [Alphaproteobacteria bacterium]